MSLLAIDQLVKSYQRFSLGPLSLSVEQGSSVGLIGANGAGKTTLFRCLMGTVRRQQGTARLDGSILDMSNPRLKQHIGHVGDYTPLFDSWSGYKNLATFSQFYPDWSDKIAQENARRLNLDLHSKAGTYSTGQRTKLAIVLALAHQPKLLLLDEPTAGLDPVSRENFLELLFEYLATENRSLIYATHHIAEIEQLVDRLVFISEGQVNHDAIKEDLTEKWKRITFRSENLPAEIPHVVSQRGDHPYHELISDDGEVTSNYLSSHGAENIEVSRLTVEKIAVEILRSSARELSHV